MDTSITLILGKDSAIKLYDVLVANWKQTSGKDDDLNKIITQLSNSLK